MGYSPVATFAPASIDACGSWRMFFPKLYVPGARFIFTEGPPPVDELSEADVCIVQRMLLEGNVEWIRIMRGLGIKIIFDLDDNLWSLPSSNYAKKFFKKEQHQKGLEACAEWADIFTVSTDPLAKVVEKKWGSLRNVATGKKIPIMKCENRVPLQLFQRQEGIDLSHDDVVIGFAGSNTHAGDMFDIWEVLYKILQSHSNVRLEVVGQPPPQYLFRHPRVRMRQWVHISEYPGRAATWNWDIVVAPLEDHRFNESKSSIRMQEAGALHRPCLSSSIYPYIDFVSKGAKELKYLLCVGGLQWETKLRELVENASLRKELGEAMYANVCENYHIEQSVPEWEAAIHAAFNA